MAADGRVLIVEREIGAPNEGAAAKWVDVVMLAMAGGRERTLQEFEKLLASAGLRLVSATRTSGSFVVYEAAR
jgi:hypothetical protein